MFVRFIFTCVVSMFLIIFATLDSVSARPASAEVGGTISVDTVWTAAESPYLVTSDITVIEDVTLTLEAGTEILFGSNDDLLIEGSLKAVGTQEQPIKLTSSQTSPSRADWGYLSFRPSSTESLLEHVTIEYGYGVSIASSDVTISNSTIQKNYIYGIAFTDVSPTIQTSQIINNEGVGIKYEEFGSAPLLLNNTISGNSHNDISFPNGTISQPLVIGHTNVMPQLPYRPRGDLTVANGVTLTIKAGTEILFSGNEDLLIEGSLRAIGTQDQPIKLTSNETTPRRADWGYLSFSPSSTDSLLEHVIVEYGYGVYIASSDVTISNSTIQKNYIYGIAFTDVSPTIQTSQIINNEGVGIKYEEFGSAPLLLNNTISGNSHNDVSFPNGTISQPLVIGHSNVTPQLPYRPRGDLTVANGVTLTIKAGTEILFSGNEDLLIEGSLRAIGTQDQPIKFTSNETTPRRADWGYLSFSPSSTDSLLEHVIVEYGYGVYIASSDVTISNSTIQKNYIYGIAFTDVSPTIQTSQIINNEGVGIKYEEFGSAPLLLNNTISGNSHNDISFPNGTISQPLVIGHSNVTPQLPYRPRGDLTVANGVTLTIKAGTEILFSGNEDLLIEGSLRAIGTQDQPIKLTSNETTPRRADWGYLSFSPSSTDSLLEHVIVEYGYGVYIASSDVTISNSTIQKNYIYGIAFTDVSPTIQTSQIINNEGVGIKYEEFGSAPLLLNNTISGNSHNDIGFPNGTISQPLVIGHSNVTPQLPYRPRGDLTVANSVTLTIEAGTEILFSGNEDLLIEGSLRAIGTQDQPIKFTSNETTPRRADWGYLSFSPSSTDSLLEHVIVEYGYGVYIASSDITISNSTIQENYYYGIKTENATPTLTNNEILNNRSNGIINETPATVVDARQTWWGDITGPTHPTLNPDGMGNAVSDGVLFEPWTIPPGLEPVNPTEPVDPIEPAPTQPEGAAPRLNAETSCALEVDANGDGFINANDTARCTVNLENQGDGMAMAALYRNNLNSNITLIAGSVRVSQGAVEVGNNDGDRTILIQVGNLAAGGSASIQFDIQLSNTLSSDLDFVPISGYISCTEHPVVATRPPSGAPGIAGIAIGQRPVITANKSVELIVDLDGNGIAGAGDTLEYTAVIYNSGTAAEPESSFVDRLDPNTTLIVGSVNSSQGTVVSGNASGESIVNVEIGSLAPSDSVTINFQVRINRNLPSTITRLANLAVCIYPDSPPACVGTADGSGLCSPVETPVQLRPVLLANKNAALYNDADGNGIPSIGDTLIYQISIQNRGNQAATNIVITDLLNSVLTYVPDSVLSSKASTNMLSDGSLVININSIAPNERVDLSFEATLNSTLSAGTSILQNQVTISSNEVDDLIVNDTGIPVSADQTIDESTLPSDMRLTLSSLVVSDTGIRGESAGDTLLYLATLENRGRGNATQLVFETTLDPNITIIDNSVQTERGTVTIDSENGQTILRIGIETLRPNERIRIGYRAIINPNPSARQITAQGRAAYTDSTSTERLSVMSDNPATIAGIDPTGAQLLSGIYLSIISQPSVCVEQSNTSVDAVLVIDRSSSMGTDGKLATAKVAAAAFMDQMNFPTDQASIASFSAAASLDQMLTTNQFLLDVALANLQTQSGTAVGEGIAVAMTELQSVRQNSQNSPVIIVLSDGNNAEGQDPLAAANAAKASGISIFTIGLGGDANSEQLRNIASGPDNYFFAPDAKDLEQIYQQIGQVARCSR